MRGHCRSRWRPRAGRPSSRPGLNELGRCDGEDFPQRWAGRPRLRAKARRPWLREERPFLPARPFAALGKEVSGVAAGEEGSRGGGESIHRNDTCAGMALRRMTRWSQESERRTGKQTGERAGRQASKRKEELSGREGRGDERAAGRCDSGGLACRVGAATACQG